MSLVYFLPLLLVVVYSNVGFSQEQAGGNQAAGQSSSSILRKAFPGGRDETDLSVQPHKRITKREAQGDESMEGEEPEPDAVGDTEDFGE